VLKGFGYYFLVTLEKYNHKIDSRLKIIKGIIQGFDFIKPKAFTICSPPL